jgi:RHS repeat-associated protein
MTSSNTHGVSASYQYDSQNRLSSVVDANLSSGSQATSYTYDSASNVGTVTLPNGVTSTFTYDTQNRVTGLSSTLSSTAQAEYDYTRGYTGDLTDASEKHGGTTDRTVHWNFDNIYRLTSETIASAPSGHDGSVDYSLDPVGNRLSDTSSITGITAGTWTFNADDEVSGESYDQNGNVTAADGKTFTYDSESHLMTMSGSSSSATMVYDGDGNRVAKTVNGVTTQYLVDDLNPTGYAQVMEELEGGAVTRQYAYGLQRIDEEQVVSGAWTPSFYGYDGGGNVRQLTNTAGAVTDSYEYDAYGNEFTVSGTTPNEFMYRGEEFDSDLGLYYLRARYYNPVTGRFMSRDPEDGEPTNPRTLHKYLYAGGDPVNALDPTGRAELFETALIVGGSALGPVEVLLANGSEAFSLWLESGPVSFVAARIPDIINWIYESQALRSVYRQIACLVVAAVVEEALTDIPFARNQKANNLARLTLVTAADRACIEFTK